MLALLEQRGGALAADCYRSAHFIEGPVYGTRSSTVVLLDSAGKLTFIERSYDAAARLTGEIRETLELERGGASAVG